MSSHFVVGTHNETPKLYIAQHDYSQILTDLRSWCHNYNMTAHVYAARKLQPWSDQRISVPPNHTELTLVAVQKPDSYLDQCMYAWGNQLDEVPPEQADEALHAMYDYCEHRRKYLDDRKRAREERQNAKEMNGDQPKATREDDRSA